MMEVLIRARATSISGAPFEASVESMAWAGGGFVDEVDFMRKIGRYARSKYRRHKCKQREGCRTLARHEAYRRSRSGCCCRNFACVANSQRGRQLTDQG